MKEIINNLFKATLINVILLISSILFWTVETIFSIDIKNQEIIEPTKKEKEEVKRNINSITLTVPIKKEIKTLSTKDRFKNRKANFKKSSKKFIHQKMSKLIENYKNSKIRVAIPLRKPKKSLPVYEYDIPEEVFSSWKK